MRPNGELVALISLEPRDVGGGVRPDELTGFGARGALFAKYGLRLVEFRRAREDEIEASRSSWAKRLRAMAERPTWSIRFAFDQVEISRIL